jgi:hypothetical protein
MDMNGHGHDVEAAIADAMATSHHLELFAAAATLRQAVEDRDEAIQVAYRDGVPAVEIAALVGLTRQRIWQIATAS